MMSKEPGNECGNTRRYHAVHVALARAHFRYTSMIVSWVLRTWKLLGVDNLVDSSKRSGSSILSEFRRYRNLAES